MKSVLCWLVVETYLSCIAYGIPTTEVQHLCFTDGNGIAHQFFIFPNGDMKYQTNTNGFELVDWLLLSRENKSNGDSFIDEIQWMTRDSISLFETKPSSDVLIMFHDEVYTNQIASLQRTRTTISQKFTFDSKAAWNESPFAGVINMSYRSFCFSTNFFLCACCENTSNSNIVLNLDHFDLLTGKSQECAYSRIKNNEQYSLRILHTPIGNLSDFQAELNNCGDSEGVAYFHSTILKPQDCGVVIIPVDFSRESDLPKKARACIEFALDDCIETNQESIERLGFGLSEFHIIVSCLFADIVQDSSIDEVFNYLLSLQKDQNHTDN